MEKAICKECGEEFSYIPSPSNGYLEYVPPHTTHKCKSIATFNDLEEAGLDKEFFTKKSNI